MSWTTLSTPVKMKFNNPMDASTITINTADTMCSGSIQITTLAANFANCLQFSSLSAETRNSVITATLTADLDPNSDYIIKIAGTITDFRGKTLGAAHISVQERRAIRNEPRIVSVTQANDWDFTVTFSRQMNTASFGTLIDGTCSGNVNLQETAGTCNNMWRTLTTGDNITYTITYKNPPPRKLCFYPEKEILDKFSIPLTAHYTANLRRTEPLVDQIDIATRQREDGQIPAGSASNQRQNSYFFNRVSNFRAAIYLWRERLNRRNQIAAFDHHARADDVLKVVGVQVFGDGGVGGPGLQPDLFITQLLRLLEAFESAREV